MAQLDHQTSPLAPSTGVAPSVLDGRGTQLPSSGYAAQSAALSPSAQGYEQGAEAVRTGANDALAANRPLPAQYAGRSAAFRIGYRDGMSQGEAGLRTIEDDARTQQAISGASAKTGVEADDLTAMAIIESTGNRNVGTNAYGYSGLMQMGSDAARDLGMSYSGMKGGANVNNNALAGARYWELNDQRLDPGVPRDPLHMYLAHQQGAGGTNTLMRGLKTNPKAAANSAQRNNVPSTLRRQLGRPITRQDFYDYWQGKMTAIQDTIAARRNPTA